MYVHIYEICLETYTFFLKIYAHIYSLPHAYNKPYLHLQIVYFAILPHANVSKDIWGGLC